MQTDNPSASILPQNASKSAWEILQSDVLAWSTSYAGPKFHAILCDPPYHLTSITKRFGKPTSAPAKPGTDGAFARASAGFMGQAWDGGDLAFQPETWAALTAHLYPGGFGMAFASSRGWHRMAVAIEDAGLIIHPSLFGWAYLTGFPKATRVNTGEWEESNEIESLSDIRSGQMHAGRDTGKVYERKVKKPTGKAEAFSGHRYGLQALKPALEPIIVFQKPYEARPVDSITETGAGALWIDGGRIEAEKLTGWAVQPSRGYNGLDSDNTPRPVNGRWPANFTLTHSPACNATCAPNCPVRLFDEQGGERAGGGDTTGNEPSELTKNTYGKRDPVAFAGYKDSGPASRMFHRSDWAYEVAEQLAVADPVRYEPKASSAEREAGLDSFPPQTRHRVNSGGLENEPRFAPTQVKNHHPTVKPIALTKYLATLLLPPAAYERRILIPFAGVGSEMIGAVLAGWDSVTGIEGKAEYVEIAMARLGWWSAWPGWGQRDVDTILAATGGESASQERMF